MAQLDAEERAAREPVEVGRLSSSQVVDYLRLEHEFGCAVSMTSTPWVAARLVDGPIAAVRRYGVSFVEDSRGRTLALFESNFTLARLLEDVPPGLLVPVGIDAADPLAEIAA